MTAQSERKSAFSAVALASQFLHEAEKHGLTPELLQCLRESPKRMSEVVSSAKQAQEDRFDRIRRLQYEKECAVDIDGVHYHLVLITCRDLMDWGCTNESLISEVVSVAARRSYEPLREEAYPTALKLLKTVPPPGQWIGWTDSGGLRLWIRTSEGMGFETTGSYVDGTRLFLFHFPKLSGMVFMQKFVGCDYNPVNQS